jgi:hypothetical protein
MIKKIEIDLFTILEIFLNFLKIIFLNYGVVIILKKKVEDLKKGMYAPMEVYDIDEDEIDFDIDYILDRISEVGIENLTPDEKEFLDNYNSK